MSKDIVTGIISAAHQAQLDLSIDMSYLYPKHAITLGDYEDVLHLCRKAVNDLTVHEVRRLFELHEAYHRRTVEITIPSAMHNNFLEHGPGKEATFWATQNPPNIRDHDHVIFHLESGIPSMRRVTGVVQHITTTSASPDRIGPPYDFPEGTGWTVIWYEGKFDPYPVATGSEPCDRVAEGEVIRLEQTAQPPVQQMAEQRITISMNSEQLREIENNIMAQAPWWYRGWRRIFGGRNA